MDMADPTLPVPLHPMLGATAPRRSGLAASGGRTGENRTCNRARVARPKYPN
jgi:hypothetical protein